MFVFKSDQPLKVFGPSSLGVNAQETLGIWLRMNPESFSETCIIERCQKVSTAELHSESDASYDASLGDLAIFKICEASLADSESQKANVLIALC